jgi:flagellar biosynthesis protein FliQ
LPPGSLEDHVNELMVMKLAKDAIWLILLVSAPALLLGLVIGLIVSVFQAVTSIQEMTLAMIPKILAVFVALLVCGPWSLRLLTSYAHQIIANIPNYLR